MIDIPPRIALGALVLSLPLLFSCRGREVPAPDYLGQIPPADTAEIFAPGVVSVEGRYEYGLSISPSFDEVFFTASDPGDGLMRIVKEDGRWLEPELADLRREGAWEFEAFFSPVGERVFFTSTVDEASRIFFSEKEGEGWSTGRLLDSPINDRNVFWSSLSGAGTIFYTDIENRRILKSEYVDGGYPEMQDPEIPGSHPYVSLDENFILFNRSGEFGRGDIFVVFKEADGSWGVPVNLGEKINTAFSETCPSLSPDERYIFFSRYNELENKSNIYWVPAQIIEDARGAFLPEEG